jgi:hypothetical protein
VCHEKAEECAQGYSRHLATETLSPSSLTLRERAEVIGTHLWPFRFGPTKSLLQESGRYKVILPTSASRCAGHTFEMFVKTIKPPHVRRFRERGRGGDNHSLVLKKPDGEKHTAAALRP